MVAGGQRNDGALLEQVFGDIRVPRHSGGRPLTRPNAVLADKAYSSGVIRRALRARGISAVIPEKSNQIAARKRRGCRGGRPSQEQKQEHDARSRGSRYELGYPCSDRDKNEANP